MGASCIITDNAAQFSMPITSNDLVLRLIDHKISIGQPSSKLTSEFPSKSQNALLNLKASLFVPPTFDEIFEIISKNINKFDEIFIILHSKELNPVYDLIQQFLLTIHGRASVFLIDSQTLSVGQGNIIQYAVNLIKKGIPGVEIDRLLREFVPHVYTLLCTPNLSYLYNAGFIDLGQSIVGEMMSLLPIFAIENGKLNPLEKVKNMHNLVDYFIEFIDEFESIDRITFLQPSAFSLSEVRIIKQSVEENHPQTIFSEVPINPFLTALIGPKGFGLVVSEKFN